MKWLKVFAPLAVLLLAFGALPSFAQDAADPLSGAVYLTFDKSAIAEDTWEGTVGGDIVGNLTTQLTDVERVGPVWFVEFDWIVDAGDQSFSAHLSGTLNTLTGTVVMDGEVVEGYLVGTRVYEQGEQAVAADGRFQGTILLLPGTETARACETDAAKAAEKQMQTHNSYPCL
jgi:hypothetical protein